MALELNSSLIGKTLDFDTHAPAILGSRIKGAKLLGILDPDTAKQLGFDITLTHLLVYPYLPQGTPDNPVKYNYLKFMLNDGSIQVYGMPWVKESSLTLVNTTTISATIKGRGHEDIDQLRKVLIASGFEDFSIELIT